MSNKGTLQRQCNFYYYLIFHDSNNVKQSNNHFYEDQPQTKHKKPINILSLPSQERPREKLIKLGSGSLTDTELISIVLGSGIRNKNVFELASQVLEVLQGASLEEENLYGKLISIKGIGDSKACSLAAIFEIAKRSTSSKAKIIYTPKEIYHLLHSYTHCTGFSVKWSK